MLALNSVKWYVQQVFNKLGVNRRGDVVERARALGLHQPEAAVTLSQALPGGNLPNPLTSFIGRESELAYLSRLLPEKNTRLVTLTGSGGTGKTRLALEAASALHTGFPDSVWLVELAPLADPLLVPQAVLAALSQVEAPEKTPIDFLSGFLREKQLLLILDNCEHLVEACAELATLLLQRTQSLTILTTSREILGVTGEIAYRVPPLTMPAAGELPPLDELAHFDALRLFSERAAASAPGFTLSQANASAVVQIAARMDGIPLALELAAARLRLLSPAQIAARLDDAFYLLTGGSRTALPRHQTLRALIDWSYHLLSEPERALLSGLSVFAGSWTLEAAEGVFDSNRDILDLLGQLVDKSLICVVQAEDGSARFHMLEIVRQYAKARLAEADETQAARSRHLSYFLELAERKEPHLRGKKQIETLDELGLVAFGSLIFMMN